MVNQDNTKAVSNTSKMFESFRVVGGEHLRPHFKSVLNQPTPLKVAPLPAFNDLEIIVNTPIVREVADAIRSLKNGKVTGIYAFHAEMLYVNLSTSARVFCPFFNEV